MSILNELKHRRIYRAAAAYAVAAWVVLQFSATVGPIFGWPAWSLKAVVVVLFVGFAAALVVGWALDRPALINTAGQAITSHRRHFGLAALALLPAAAVTTGFLMFYHPATTKKATPSPPEVAAFTTADKSIAVLPFENLSANQENAFFTDGVQDEILTDLAKVADLKVISRTSVMQYKSGEKRNLREIATALGVAHVVEGSVQRSGNRVRVNAQLIDARTDTHVWAEHYDRELADVFGIQSELAQAIADQLRARLSPAEKAAIQERPTADLKAYELYTEANYLVAVWIGTRDSTESILKAERLLNEAVRLDPNFVLAYCRLADAEENIYFYSIDRTPARLVLAKQAVDAAVRLRPDLGDTHLAQARYAYFVLRDYGTARDQLALALRTLPNDAGALFSTALIDRRQHRWDDALKNLAKANALDPRNVEIMRSVSDTLLQMRSYKRQEEFLTREVTLPPESSAILHMKLAESRLAQGDPAGAQNLLEQMPVAYDPNGYASLYRFTAALYLRDYDSASRIVAAGPATMPDALIGGRASHDWFDGQIARARGDLPKAMAAFTATRTEFAARIAKNKEDLIDLALLARMDAGRGDKQSAIREAIYVTESRSIEKDSGDGPAFVGSLAAVYAWTGERERALEQLERVAKLPAGPSYGDLKLNPRWDSLRGDALFEKMLTDLAPR